LVDYHPHRCAVSSGVISFVHNMPINSASIIIILTYVDSHFGVSNGMVDRGPENVVKLYDSTAMLECVREDSAQWFFVSEMNVTSVAERFIPVEDTNARWHRSENKTNHELYINNLQFNDAGLYYCAPKNSNKFPGKAAYIVTVAHRPFCFPESTERGVSKLSCWITYRGMFDVRLIWKNDDGRQLAERIFTSLKMSLSSFNLPLQVNASYEEIYTCEVQFIATGVDSVSYASNTPTFDEGVCETSNVPAKLRAQMFNTVDPCVESVTATTTLNVAAVTSSGCGTETNIIIGIGILFALTLLALSAGLFIVLVYKEATNFTLCKKRISITTMSIGVPTQEQVIIAEPPRYPGSEAPTEMQSLMQEQKPDQVAE